MVDPVTSKWLCGLSWGIVGLVMCSFMCVKLIYVELPGHVVDCFFYINIY